MSNRRTFIKQIGGLAGAIAFTDLLSPFSANGFNDVFKNIAELAPAEAAKDEDFWGWIKECFTVTPNVINLNNGGVSPQPKVVQDAVIRFYQLANEGPAYYMNKMLGEGRESLRMRLADLAGCSTEEIAINRNTTEAINTVIFGLNLKAGDEVLLARQDYPSMRNAWEQRVKRDGIKLNYLNLNLPLENEKEIVRIYEDAFTDKTKVVMIMHMINYNGQIMPVKEIARAAHKRGIEVLVDGAHTFAHLDFKIPDLECDYFGTSLHKWLCAPFGTGLLYIKKEKIKNIWPLLSDNNPDRDDIRKFESLGTRSIPNEMAIAHAIDFHNIIGSKRKEERMRYLKNYWTDNVSKLPKVSINTSSKPELSCGLAHFSIEGKTAKEIESILFDKFKIYSAVMEIENIKGIRITPHLYIATKDLDRLIEAIKFISKS
ncbi:MAG: aminotransferase class V-fold PLP-dependent enzyme [Bacteroidales bacterium]|nr:aminotransferase class V-fold PLP-dependent enzyme [Bacteroidales bacterium]